MHAAVAQDKFRLLGLSIGLINLDGDTQSRRTLSQSVVEDYAQLMSEGVAFPAVRVWFDGDDYWLSDGFHRVEAAKRIGKDSILASIHDGTIDDARWDSLSVNASHGLRRSARDIEFVVDRALRHRRATGMSVNQLAKHLGLPEPTLRRWIKRLTSSNDEGSSEDAADNLSANSTTVPLLRDNHRIYSELAQIKHAARQKETVALVNVLEKWLCGMADTARTCKAIDRFFDRYRSCTDL